MGKHHVSRRSFLARMGQATLAVVLGSIAKIVPETGGALAGGLSSVPALGRGNRVRLSPLTGTDLAEAVRRLMADPNGQLLWRHLVDSQLTPNVEMASGAEIREDESSGGRTGFVVTVPFSSKDDRSGSIFFATDGHVTRAGAGIKVQAGSSSATAQGFEVIGGKVTRTEKLLRDQSGNVQIFKPDGSSVNVPSRLPATTTASDCDTCRSVFEYVWAAGCGIAGYLVCTLACAPFAGPACPIICAAVYAMICVWGYGNNVDMVCDQWC